MGIETKTVGVLIDELCTVSQKCFRAQDNIMASPDDTKTAKAAREAQMLNARRCELIRAIDKMLGQQDASITKKTYSNE